jgi:penicillin-binding protein 1C
VHLWVLPLMLLIAHAAWLEPQQPHLLAPASVRVLDRSGQTLAEVRDARAELSLPVRRGELSPWVVPALLAAEDSRFYLHPGIDVLAMARAALQAVQNGRVVSGGSTITQQLARTLFERPRTLWGKWQELARALRLEAELDKDGILEAYLNRVYFGPGVRGLGAAARYYFDKPASALSLAEAAALVATVQGPSRLDPARFPARLERRRNHVLARVLELGLAEPEAVVVARRAPLLLHQGFVAPGGFHFVRAAVTGKLEPARSTAESAAPVAPGGARTVLHSTLDAGLQREVERLVRGFDARFAEHRASAAAVLVVENRTAAVRAYVGSPDHRDRAALGQNDGVFALRQPGSTLKPFVYALGLWDLGLNPASLLPDIERRFGSAQGEYLPHNYDRRFHGPVRLAQALGSSLNVPAVILAEQLGPERILTLLRELGFSHLTQTGSYYGPAIALGVAEVQLAELAAAYATLGRGGAYLPLRFFETEPLAAPRRVLPEAVARQITQILSDPRERAATFGRDGPLELDLPVAVKTGTSKGNRDNWVVGVLDTLTVAVWVGNFDGSPMLRSSGATGAGPLFHVVMEAALRELPASERPPLTAAARSAQRLSVCALSGLLAGPDCPHRLALDLPLENAPAELCTWHERRCPAPADGGLGACGVVERIPEPYAAWAHDSGRVQSSAAPSPPGVPGQGLAPARGTGSRPPRVVFPEAHQRFVLDPRVSPAQAELLLRAEADPSARVRFEVDGQSVCDAHVPFACPWPLRRGQHQLVVWTSAERSAPLAFSVE